MPKILVDNHKTGVYTRPQNVGGCENAHEIRTEEQEMKYGQELIEQLERQIEAGEAAARERQGRINSGETDEDDCFISIRCNSRDVQLCRDKIDLIKNGGTALFHEFATLDGQLVEAHLCNTRYGSRMRVVMPDGSVVWTSAETKRGLARVGLKRVLCRRPAWYCFKSSDRGMLGVYLGNYVLFPSDTNYATGEAASAEPLEVIDA